MLGWLFNSSHKKEIENVKEEVKNSFFNVKNDLDKIGEWVTHLNNEGVGHKKDVSGIKDDLSMVKKDLEELKELVSLFSVGVNKQLFKTQTAVYSKQTAVEGVQTPVQTPVQTGNFQGISNLTISERAIVWLLANNDMKLSYDDLAAMLGKTRSTIRGQINSIKQKSEGLIEEYIEKSGKKRVYMPEGVKGKMLKKAKVRVRNERRG